MEKQYIIERIQDQIAGAKVECSGEDCQFQVMVKSDSFIGMTPVKRQQKVLRLFTEELQSGAIHALSVRCETI